MKSTNYGPRDLKPDTPWGGAHGRDEYAPGVASYDTPSHGGFHLSPAREACRQSRFPEFQTFAGGPWYEEDADWSVVALTFPELFEPIALRRALECVDITLRINHDFGGTDAAKCGQWAQIFNWSRSDDDEAREIRRRVADWEEEHAEHWQPGGMSSGAGIAGWSVRFTRVCDGEKRTVPMPRYPGFEVYSLSELDAFDEAERVRVAAEARRATG